MRISRIALFSMICLGLAGAVQASAFSDPFGYFNVYSLGDIGSAAKNYGSDFQGTAGAGGDVWTSGFTMAGLGGHPETGFAAHVGGNLTIGSGSYHGHVEAGGDVLVGSFSIAGDVRAGGSIANAGGGSIAGNVHAAGGVNLSQQVSVAGSVTGGGAYSPLVDLGSVSDFFKAESQAIANMTQTTQAKSKWGKITIDADAGVNVVKVSAKTLEKAWGVEVKGPADAIVYINVVGDPTAKLDSTVWTYTGGITEADVLLNYADATELELSSANNVNLLAPFAATDFSAGLLTGNLIVGNLTGGGQVNLGGFNHGRRLPAPIPTPDPEPTGDNIPEPATLLGVGLAIAFAARRFRSR